MGASNATGEASEAVTFPIGTVERGLHDVGKNLVAMMLKGIGFKAIDLGMDIMFNEFIAGVQELKPDILGLSALLITIVPKMQENFDAHTEAGCGIM